MISHLLQGILRALPQIAQVAAVVPSTLRIFRLLAIVSVVGVLGVLLVALLLLVVLLLLLVVVLLLMVVLLLVTVVVAVDARLLRKHRVATWDQETTSEIGAGRYSAAAAACTPELMLLGHHNLSKFHFPTFQFPNPNNNIQHFPLSEFRVQGLERVCVANKPASRRRPAPLRGSWRPRDSARLR